MIETLIARPRSPTKKLKRKVGYGGDEDDSDMCLDVLPTDSLKRLRLSEGEGTSRMV